MKHLHKLMGVIHETFKLYKRVSWMKHLHKLMGVIHENLNLYEGVLDETSTQINGCNT